MVTALADLPRRSDEFDTLLRAGGELTWRAGPLTKGSNLCHGTGGNGYAFLKLHQRFGDPMWLERARAFAMAAIAQCRAARIAHGMGRYTLWTGDPGLAVYLWDCITAGRASRPSMCFEPPSLTHFADLAQDLLRVLGRAAAPARWPPSARRRA